MSNYYNFGKTRWSSLLNLSWKMAYKILRFLKTACRKMPHSRILFKALFMYFRLTVTLYCWKKYFVIVFFYHYDVYFLTQGGKFRFNLLCPSSRAQSLSEEVISKVKYRADRSIVWRKWLRQSIYVDLED